METKLLTKDFLAEIRAGQAPVLNGVARNKKSQKHSRKRNANFLQKFRGT
jgi:hypothetical protein